MQNVAAETV